MLVRQAAERTLEVFMLRRSEASHFVPDVYVFPGGTLDAADMAPEALVRARGIDQAALAQQFRAKPAPGLPAPAGSPSGQEAAGLLVAAVRELYEEAGVLLACDASGAPVAHGHGGPREPFFDLLERIDAYADCTQLSLFSQWITPAAYPRRYNAHFFVARASLEHNAVADAYETHDGIWIAPQDALTRCACGNFSMVYPTIKHVERLAQFESVDDLLHFTRTKPIYSIMPLTPGELQFALPPELEYAW